MRRLPSLLLLPLLVACPSSKTASGLPPAPTGVTAHAGDGQVTVLWDSVSGAIGYRVYTASATAPILSGTHVDVGAVTSWTVVGLTNGTAAQFAVSALSSGGEGPLSSVVQATPQANVAIAVSSVDPADGTASVPRNAAVTVHFNRPATGVTASACTGSFQLSDDNFATCAAGALVSSDAGATWAFTPSPALHGSASYKLRLTTAVQDANAIPLGAAFTSAGFTTAAELSVTLAPSGSVGGKRPPITLTFNRAPKDATLTSGCAGSVQLSADNFTTCVPLSHTLAGSTATFTPTVDLAAGASYVIKISTAVHDSDDLPLNHETTGGFTTPGALAVLSFSPADASVNVDRATAISVTFNRAPVQSTVIVNTADTACSGSLQLSSDDFATCVQAAGAPAASSGGTVFTFTPAAQLAPATRYKLRAMPGVQDSGGVGIAQAQAVFVTGPPLAVASSVPADGATGVILTSALTLTFNRAVDPATMTTGPGCTGNVQLQLAPGSCATLTASSTGNVTWHLTPSPRLSGSSAYKLIVTTGVKDPNGAPLGTATTAAFQTEPELAVISSQPADNATAVSLDAKISVTFNRPVTGVTANTQPDGACTGSLFVSSGTSNGVPCVQMTGAPVGSNGGLTWTVTPKSQLAASTRYFVHAAATIPDADGARMPAAYVQATGFVTGTGVDTTPPANPSGVSVSTRLQSATLAWTNPADADFAGAHVYAALSGSGSYSLLFTGNAATATVPLAPGTAYDFKVTAFDQSGNESAGVTASATTQFSGDPADWLSGQTLIAEHGARVRFTWNATTFFAGISDGSDAALLSRSQSPCNLPDRLWLAISTGTTAKTARLIPTTGANDVTLPILADFVVDLQPNHTLSTVSAVDVYTGVDTGPLAGAGNYDGNVQEVSFPKSALPGTDFKLAVIAFNQCNGYTYEILPASTQAVNVTGYFGSAVAALDLTGKAFDPARASSSASSGSTVLSPYLHTFQVHKAGAGLLKVLGSTHPLSWVATDTVHQLYDDGTHGDLVAGDGVYGGALNLSDPFKPLWFKFAEDGNEEGSPFAVGTDRATLLAAPVATLPVLEWATAYSASHPFSVSFTCAGVPNGAGPFELRGGTAPLAWDSGTPMTLDTGAATATVSFGAVNPTAAPLEFKCVGSGGNFEPGANNSVNDDIIGHTALVWTWGEGKAF